MKLEKSIAEKVKEYIEKQPYLKYTLKKGLINYSSLARKIQEDLEIKNFDAIVVAIRRYLDKFSKTNLNESQIKKVLEKSTLEINTGINIYILKEKIENLGKHHMITSNNLTLIISKDNLDIPYYKKHNNVVEISIKSPEKIEEQPGLVLEIMQKLFEFNINIIEMYSCYTNTILIVEKNDLINTINALNYLKIK